MKELVLDRLLKDLDGSIGELERGEPQFHEDRYEPKPLRRDNFNPLSLPEEDGRKISFIDGGNMELCSSPAFSIHLVRIYFNIFRDNERANPEELPQKIDFYTLVRTSAEDGEMHYEGGIYPLEEDCRKYLPEEGKLNFDSWDRSLMRGRMRADINRVSESARRFAEWKIAGLIAEKELSEGDILVRDGSLQTAITNEAQFAKEAYERAKENRVIFSGLAKTTRLYTTSGNSLAKVVRDLGESVLPGKRWFYFPVADVRHPDHRAEIFFTKLHEQSDYVFRYEINKDQFKNLEGDETRSILGSLAENSRDIGFPGYPYGLIDADKFASVSRYEGRQHLARLKGHASKGGRWKEMKKYLTATDAHKKLDRLKR